MLTNLFQLFGRDPDKNDYEQAFVKEIAVHEKPPRDIRLERIILIGWILIAFKCTMVWWACAHYQVPIHPLWIIAPTIMFGLLCTIVYIGRR